MERGVTTFDYPQRYSFEAITIIIAVGVANKRGEKNRWNDLVNERNSDVITETLLMFVVSRFIY